MVKKRKEELKDLCENSAVRHKHSKDSLSKGLELLALEVIAQDVDFADSILDGESAKTKTFEDWNTGGKDDGGIDGLLYSSELDQVAIIQTKYKSGKIDADTDEEARSFFSRLSEWSDTKKRSNYNEQTQRLLDEAQLDPKRQTIQLYFITTQSSNDDGGHSALADHHTAIYQDAGRNVTCTYLCGSEFLTRIENLENLDPDYFVKEVSLDFQKDKHFIFKENDYRVLVAAVKGQSISDLYNRKDVKAKLFNANVRLALTTGKINEKIKQTAEDEEESGRFFYYNNGITATCSEMDIQGNTLNAKDIQVVNGAQTVASLGKAFKREGRANVYVLLRVIETGHKYGKKSEVADKITKYQNTQNPVKLSDFFSNEPFHKWIAERIDQLSGKGLFPALFYKYKRGMPTSTGRKELSMENLAYLRYAALHDAPFTYKTPKDIWGSENDSEKFWLAFGSNGERVEAWTDEELAETAWLIQTWLTLRKSHSDMRKDKESKNLERTYLGVMARYITALAFTLMRELRRRKKFESFEELTQNTQASRELNKTALRLSRNAVKVELENNPRWKAVANARLNLPQDGDTWSRLKEKVIQDHDFEADLNR